MTKKEKKDEALRWKAIIDARKPKPELTPDQKEMLFKKKMEEDNHRRRQRDKARDRKGSQEVMGKKYIPKGWDFEKW